MRVAIIGLGGMGALHAGIVSAIPGCDVVAVVDQEPRLVHFAAKAIPHIHFYTDTTEMLRIERPDVVYVCTPPATHLQVTQTILEHDSRPRGLFVEKPLAPTLAEAELMAGLARAHGTITGVGFQRRFFPTLRRARELLRGGAIGEVLLIRAHHFSAGVAETGEGWRFSREYGGAALELGVHLLDALLWLFGEPRVLSHQSLRFVSLQCDDYVDASLKFPQGAFARFEVGWSIWGFNPDDFRIDVYGTEGGIGITRDELRISPKPSESPLGSVAKTFHSFELVGSLPIFLGSAENVLIDVEFMNSVSAGKTSEISFDTGVQVSRVIEAIRGVREGG